MTIVTDSSSQHARLVGAIEQVVERRRSVYSYLETPVSQSVIDWAIRLAMMAPNHHKTKPWRFHIFLDNGRASLAAAYVDAALRLGRDPDRARQRAYDAPAMITVACVPGGDNPKVKIVEEEFATIMAAQNLMLGLAAAGLDSLLTTGDLVESDELRAKIGLEDTSAKVLGVINVGLRNPDRPLPPRHIPDSANYLRWITE